MTSCLISQGNFHHQGKESRQSIAQAPEGRLRLIRQLLLLQLLPQTTGRLEL